MRHYTRLLISSFAALAVFSATVNAHAQDTYSPPPNSQPPPPNGPPPPPGSQAPNGQYVAPLAQQTQQIYVPQSVAMSGPREIKDWDESQPVPPGYHVTTHVRTGMIVGGTVLFASLYLLSLLTFTISNDNGNSSYGSMAIPAAGPFLQMATANTQSTGAVFLAIDGIGQCAGIAMLIYGIASPRTYLLRNDLGFTKPMILPMKMGQDGYGAGLIAHF